MKICVVHFCFPRLYFAFGQVIKVSKNKHKDFLKRICHTISENGSERYFLCFGHDNYSRKVNDLCEVWGVCEVHLCQEHIHSLYEHEHIAKCYSNTMQMLQLAPANECMLEGYHFPFHLQLVQKYDSFADKMNGILKLQQKPINTCKTELITLSTGKFHTSENMK